jgi:hypothetical protein
MISFIPTTAEHINTLRSWITKDKFSRISTPRFWMTGESLLSFCCQDDSPVLFVRIDAEGDAARLHTLFGPPEDVSKRRIAESLAVGFPKIADELRRQGFKMAVYESVSPSLIAFMSAFGFIPSTGSSNDFVLEFEASVKILELGDQCGINA